MTKNYQKEKSKIYYKHNKNKILDCLKIDRKLNKEKYAEYY